VCVCVCVCREEFPKADLVCESLAAAMTVLQSPPLVHTIESVHVLGGQRVYEVRVRVWEILGGVLKMQFYLGGHGVSSV